MAGVYKKSVREMQTSPSNYGAAAGALDNGGSGLGSAGVAGESVVGSTDGDCVAGACEAAGFASGVDGVVVVEGDGNTVPSAEFVLVGGDTSVGAGSARTGFKVCGNVELLRAAFFSSSLSCGILKRCPTKICAGSMIWSRFAR